MKNEQDKGKIPNVVATGYKNGDHKKTYKADELDSNLGSAFRGLPLDRLYLTVTVSSVQELVDLSWKLHEAVRPIVDCFLVGNQVAPLPTKPDKVAPDETVSSESNTVSSCDSIESSNSFGGVFVGNGVLGGMQKPGGAIYDKRVLGQLFEQTKRQPWQPMRSEPQFSELELEIIRMALADYGNHGKHFFNIPGNQIHEGYQHPIAASMNLVYSVVKSLQEKIGRSIYTQVDRTSIEKASANNVGVDTTAIVEKAVNAQINAIVD